MSKKNKALKQLLKAQMQANVAAVAQKKDLTNQVIQMANTSQTIAPTVSSAPIADKQTTEFQTISRDVRLSVILILLIVAALVVIYAIDRSNPFLLKLANQIFKLLQ